WRGRKIRRGRLLGAGETISSAGAGAVSLAAATDGSILLNAAEIGSVGSSPAHASAVGFVGNPIPACPPSAATSPEFVTASLAVYSIALCMAALRPRLVTHQSLTTSGYQLVTDRLQALVVLYFETVSMRPPPFSSMNSRSPRLGNSQEDRVEHARRMGWMCDRVVEAGGTVTADFICPPAATRAAFGDTFTIHAPPLP